jgi:hypothetical protein
VPRAKRGEIWVADLGLASQAPRAAAIVGRALFQRFSAERC